MKLAINKCFGGFGLSDAVHEKLIEFGIPYYKTWDEIPKNNEDPYVIDSDHPSDTFGKYCSNFRDDDKRSNPLLIKAIEEVGVENASSQLSQIRIVDILDNIQFEIDEYDGFETVRESHRTW